MQRHDLTRIRYRAARGVLPWAGALAALCMTACDRTAIVDGAVTDISGEALPGVAVALTGRDIQATTNTLGEYRVRSKPGDIALDFSKTGYALGHVTAAVSTGFNNVTTAVLWPLPANRGVYIYRNFQFLEMDRTEPKRFLAKDMGLVFGIKREIDLVIEETQPTILFHKLPGYDVQLHQLQPAKASDPELETPDYRQNIWAPVRPIPITLAPIDEPDHLLVEVRLSEPLVPAAYALHWGALEGYTSTDSRVFLFRVKDPNETEAPVPAEDEPPATPAPGAAKSDETPAVDEAPL